MNKPAEVKFRNTASVQRLYLVSEIYGAGSSLSVDTDESVQRVASRASSCTEVDRDALAQPVTEPGM